MENARTVEFPGKKIKQKNTENPFPCFISLFSCMLCIFITFLPFQNSFGLILHQCQLFCASWSSPGNHKTFKMGDLRWRTSKFKDKERFHFDQKFQKLYKKSNWFGEFLTFVSKRFRAICPLFESYGVLRDLLKANCIQSIQTLPSGHVR